MKTNPRYRFQPHFESCEPRLLLTGVPDNDVMEIGTNLNFVFQAEHYNLLSEPTGSPNADGTQDTERLPFAFRNSIDWSTAYNFDPATGLSTASPWRESFLDDLDIYSQLRFIHWTNTNGSGVETWGQRTDPNTDQTQLTAFGTTAYGIQNGIAWEWVIDLGNRLGKDIWINIPLKADDAYVESLASLMEERLDPGLKVYVEYHNEMWLTKGIAGDDRNTSEYAEEMAIANNVHSGTGFGNVLRWQVHRSAEIWETFRSEFGSSFDSRVVKVVAGQIANPDVGRQIRGLLRDPVVNTTNPMELEHTYAVAPYFAALPEETITDPEDFEYIDSLAQTQIAVAADNVAIWVDTPVIAYEGGQSITGTNAATDEIVADVNFDPRIKQVYLDYLQGLENVGVESFNHFTHSGQKIAPDNDSDFAWGAKSYVGQPIEEAPKFAALAEFAGVAVPTGGTLVHDGAIATFDAALSVKNETESVSPNEPWVSAVTAGVLSSGPGVNAMNGSFSNSFAPAGWESSSLADAIATEEYLSFTVTVEPGYTLDVNALDGILLTQDRTRNFALLSSATGFDSSSVITDFGGPIIGTNNRQDVTVDLYQVAGLQDLTGTTEFRLYAYGGNPNQFESVGIGGRQGFDFKLSGQVVEAVAMSEELLVDEIMGSYDTQGSVRLTTTELPAESAIVPIDLSPVSSGPGVSAANAWYTDRFAPRQWQSTTLAAAIANDDYLTFSVDVASGYSLDVTEIDAYLFTQNQRARNFALLSSVTGFSSADVLSDFGGTVTGSGNYGQEARTASLNATDLTGTVEFRIYVYGAANTNQWEAVGLGNRAGDELSIVGTLKRTSGGPAVVYSGSASSFDTLGSIKNATTSVGAEEGSGLFVTSDLEPGPGLRSTNGWFNNRFAPINWNSSTLNAAIANDDYLTFELTVAPGVSVDLTEIDAYLFTQNKKSRTFALMSDVTGFNTSSVLTDFGGAVTGNANNGQEARVADLTGAALQGLTGTIEFRIYVYGSVSMWEAVGIGDRGGSDLTLSGEVAL